MLKKYLEAVRRTAPLIHNITNYVTVNDVANLLLAAGGSPIMSDEADEVEEITALCAGLNLNIGTLNHATIAAMFAAGARANLLGHPVVLDPVGVGASTLRTETAKNLISKVHFTLIKGNASEIRVLSAGEGRTNGVDATAADAMNEGSLDGVIARAKALAEKTGAVVAVTGAIDVVADATRAYTIRNGVPEMAQITGAGCMLSGLCAAYLAAAPGEALEATVAAVAAMGLCGERALRRMRRHGAGNAGFRNYLIDEMYKLDGETLEAGAKYELR